MPLPSDDRGMDQNETTCRPTTDTFLIASADTAELRPVFRRQPAVELWHVVPEHRPGTTHLSAHRLDVHGRAQQFLAVRGDDLPRAVVRRSGRPLRPQEAHYWHATGRNG